MANEVILVLQLIFEKGLEILKAPITNPQMLWMLLPLIVALFLMELYFNKYKHEELGWNSAVSNSLVLLFVALNLASYLSSKGILINFLDFKMIGLASSQAIIRSAITYFVFFEAVLLLGLNFFHIAPKGLAFGISNSLILNFIAAMSLILVYSTLIINWLVIPTFLTIFAILLLFLWIISLFAPKDDEE
ncbi:MAG: hypothetical protein ABH817_01845 [archaeon]